MKNDLLVAESNAFGIRGTFLKLSRNYVGDRFHKTKREGDFSTLDELLTDVSQGSVLGALPLSFYLDSILRVVEYTDIHNIADNNTLHSSSTDVYEVMTKLKMIAHYF